MGLNWRFKGSPRFLAARSNCKGWYGLSSCGLHVNGIRNARTNKALARAIPTAAQATNTFQGKGGIYIFNKKKILPENTGEFSVGFLNAFVKPSKILWAFILPSQSSPGWRDSSISDGALTQVRSQEVKPQRAVTEKISLDSFTLNYSTPHHKILKNLLKSEQKKESEGSRRNKDLLSH